MKEHLSFLNYYLHITASCTVLLQPVPSELVPLHENEPEINNIFENCKLYDRDTTGTHEVTYCGISFLSCCISFLVLLSCFFFLTTGGRHKKLHRGFWKIPPRVLDDSTQVFGKLNPGFWKLQNLHEPWDYIFQDKEVS